MDVGVFEQLKRGAKRFVRQSRPIYLAYLERVARRQSVWIDPDSVRVISHTISPTDSQRGTLGGSPDDTTQAFDDLDWHKACVARFRHGRDWSDTTFYKNEFAAIQAGHSAKGFGSESELQDWLDEVEELYQAAHDVGELSNSEEVRVLSVNVGRHGDMILNRGEEILSIAKLQHLHRIPAEVTARHPSWLKFRKELCRDPRGTYTPMLHPDLAWLPSRRAGHDRFDWIKSALISKNGTMLDIGCYHGYFCQRFEELGFDCVGVEVNPERFRVLEKLKRANNSKYQIENVSIFDYIGHESKEFDVVLALAVFHWFIRTEEGFHKLGRLLENIRMREMFFIPHKRSDHIMRGAYWNPTEDEFAAFVMKQAGLNTMKCLGYMGPAENNRALYHLTDEHHPSELPHCTPGTAPDEPAGRR